MSKHLRLLSRIHSISCTFQVGRLYVVPVFAQVHPGWIDILDQRNLLFPPPAFELLFARNGFPDILISLEPDQAITVVPLHEAVVLFPFVFKDSPAQVTGDADVDSMAAAHNVYVK
jgi:hypothetical protein